MGRPSSSAVTVMGRPGSKSLIEPHGTWRAVVPIGEGRRKWIRGATRAEVVKKATEVKAKRDKGLPVTSDRARVGDYLDQWLEDTRASVRTGTYNAYGSHVRIHLRPALGHLRLADVDLGAGSLRVRHQLQRRLYGEEVIWLDASRALLPTKSHRSRRVLAIPAPLVEKLRAHRARQGARAPPRWRPVGGA